jgi:hypothetical protein
MPEELHVYSARCVWSGPIKNVGMLPTPEFQLKNTGGSKPITVPASSIPCCPYCKSVLYQQEEEAWQEGVNRYAETHPGYAELLAWIEQQPRCYPTMQVAAAAFTKETGKSVILG